MTESNHVYVGMLGAPVKAWIKDVQIEQSALEQLRNVASLPFIHHHVAAMPDVHWGMGATVGSVIATKQAIIPAAVGVDVGCGMMARQLSLTANDLPDNLHGLRSAIEAAVPHGRTDNGGVNDRGAWSKVPHHIEDAFRFGEGRPSLRTRLLNLTTQHPGLQRAEQRAPNHLATLGTGNHFIEICLDENNAVWVMLHSGSRGIGNRIGSYFIEKAKEACERWHVKLPDANLAYLPEGEKLFNDYIEGITWAQEYAMLNRELMMEEVLDAITGWLDRPISSTLSAINCHHNYASKENHFGQNVWVTRKGAVRARVGDLGIIPGSMGARSFIVRGKGNPESFCSCSHGAGRSMSRGAAKKKFTLEDHIAATAGIECRKDADVLDETPGAYKDIDAVMAAQSDLVEVVHTLRQIVCVKG